MPLFTAAYALLLLLLLAGMWGHIDAASKQSKAGEEES